MPRLQNRKGAKAQLAGAGLEERPDNDCQLGEGIMPRAVSASGNEAVHCAFETPPVYQLQQLASKAKLV